MIWEENVFIEKDPSLASDQEHCLIKGLNRLYSRMMVIDPEKVIYVIFSISR